MILPVLKEADPLLHRKAVPVAEIDEEIQKLIDSMIETMHVAEGVGLAANQIGSNWNILVASPDGKRGKELVLINGVIVRRRGWDRSPEGCLSLPGISADVLRSARVTATGLNRNGKPITLEAVGLPAKILQHETDHLAGHLFVDRLSFWKRRQLLKRYQAIAATLRQVEL
ncbi:MAG: peptide deformylase [Candidatus Omnitrophica bacterium]|nr:peptide deformylase [Candidatus Omnitrophota bacterium]